MAGEQGGWELLHLSRAGVSSLEDRASLILAAETAGLIALWSQVSSFEPGVSRAFAWAGWGVVLLAVVLTAWVIFPRRLADCWDTLVPYDVADAVRVAGADERRAIDELARAIDTQSTRLRRTLQGSIGLSVVALLLAAIAYVIEKT